MMERIVKSESEAERDRKLKLEFEKICVIAISLSFVYENQEAYESSMEALKLAVFFSKNFLVGNHYKELNEVINQRE
jgi:hypothetical protein